MTDMAGVDHTNPYTGEPFTVTFRRGVVAADGGERGAGPPGDNRTGTPSAATTDVGAGTDAAAMTDVEHESPTEGATRAFERGTEGRGDRV